MKPFRVLVPFVGAAASALLLTACGSSGGGGSASPTGSTSSSPSPTTPASSTADSSATTPAASGSAPTKAQLQKIVLQPSDLPAYKATPADPNTDDDNQLDKDLATCTGVAGAPESHKVNTAASQDFELSGVTISSEFSSYQSDSDVSADVAQLKSPKINDCLNTAFKAILTKSVGSGTTVDSAAIQVTPGSGGGPSNVAGLASGIVNITANGQKASIYLGIAFITGPQLDGTLTFFGVGKPLDAATQMSALAAVANRAKNP